MPLQSVAEIFDSWTHVNKIYPDVVERYGFMLRVVVSKDIPPRHSTFSWIRGMGVNKFDEIFSEQLTRLPSHWMLAFPERYCSLAEQQSLIYQLSKQNREKNLGLLSLDILTSSPYILSDSMSSIVSIIGFKNGVVTYEQDYM